MKNFLTILIFNNKITEGNFCNSNYSYQRVVEGCTHGEIKEYKDKSSGDLAHNNPMLGRPELEYWCLATLSLIVTSFRLSIFCTWETFNGKAQQPKYSIKQGQN